MAKKNASKRAKTANGKVVKLAGVQMIGRKLIRRNPDNPRKQWDETKDEDGKSPIQRLAENIRANGLLSPLVTTPRGDVQLLVCGGRRFRAIDKHLRWTTVPCLVRPVMTDAEILETAISENLMREDVSAVDQARAYHTLLEKKIHTRRSLAKKLGISEAAISYKMSLLNLSPELQRQIDQGPLTETQGRKIVQVVNRIKGRGKTAERQKRQAMDRINSRLSQARKTGPDAKLDTAAVDQISQQSVNEVVGSKVTPPQRSATKKADQPIALSRSARHRGKLPLSGTKARELAMATRKQIEVFAKTSKQLQAELADHAKCWQVAVELAKLVPGASQFVYDAFNQIGHLHRVLQEAEKEPEVLQARTRAAKQKGKKKAAKKKVARKTARRKTHKISRK